MLFGRLSGQPSVLPGSTKGKAGQRPAYVPEFVSSTTNPVTSGLEPTVRGAWCFQLALKQKK